MSSLATLRRRRAATLAGPAITPSAPYRDRQLLALVAAALDATGQFDDVRTDGRPDLAGAQAGRVASLDLSGFEDDYDALGDGYSGSPVQHTVTFTVTLQVRDVDANTCKDVLDRLRAVISNAVNGQSFGGVTLPDFTVILRGSYASPAATASGGVEQTLVIEAQFSYFLDSAVAHNEDD